MAGGVGDEYLMLQQGSYEDPLADVFDSETPPDHEHYRLGSTSHADHAGDQPSDIPRLRSIHVTSGYREGIAAGKDTSIQAGFDEGYALGAEFGMLSGRILGQLASLMTIVSTSSVLQDLTRLYERAKEELAGEKLFAPAFFDEHGIWKYAIPDAESEDETTFRKVAANHPSIVKWSVEAASCKTLHATSLRHPQAENSSTQSPVR